MDAHAAQLRRQIDATRAAMDAQLTQLEQHVSQMPAAILEQTVGGGGARRARDPHQGHHAAPPVSLADHRGWRTRELSAPPREGPTGQTGPESSSAGCGGAPQRPTVNGTRETGGLRQPAAAPSTGGRSAGTGGAHEGSTVRPTAVRLDVRGGRRDRAGAAGHRRDPGR